MTAQRKSARVITGTHTGVTYRLQPDGDFVIGDLASGITRHAFPGSETARAALAAARSKTPGALETVAATLMRESAGAARRGGGMPAVLHARNWLRLSADPARWGLPVPAVAELPLPLPAAA